MENLNTKKILIVRLSSIGDTIHTLPILSAIKNLYPSAKVYWIVESPSSFLLINNLLLENVFIIDKELIKKDKNLFNKLKYFFKIVSILQKEKFDVAIDPQGLFKSGIITLFSKASKRIGFKNTREFAEIFLTDKVNVGKIFATNEHIIEKNLKLIQYYSNKPLKVEFPLPEINKETINKINSLITKTDRTLNVGILPATLWKSKHWIKEYWSETIQNIMDDVNLYIIGTDKDNILISSITEGISKDKYNNIAGKTSLMDLIEVFKRMDIVIGVDTGPLHLAVAVKKPKIIGIYGPTSHIRTGAYGHTNLISKVDCQPCNKKTCPLKQNQHMQCMKKLLPEHLLEEYTRLKQELCN